MGRLQGKIAVITGTAGGQGRAAAIRFAAEGAHVVGCDRDVAGTLQTMKTVTDAGGQMVTLQHECDLTDPAQADKLIQFSNDTYGGVDILYNNAGDARFAPIGEMTAEDFVFTLNNEVTLIFHTVTRVWRQMIERGGGVIINTASLSGQQVARVLPSLAHSAGKGAVMAMTRQMAIEGGPHNIRAVTISPGLINVPKVGELLKINPEFGAYWKEKIMLSRFGTPEDVANVALFLASDEASFITGADFLVDGGSSAC